MNLSSLWARLKRWAHCMHHLLFKISEDHRAVTSRLSGGRLVLSCTCGRDFYDDRTEHPRCPDCNSDNLEVGAFPLRCLDCGWSYLNKNPCRVCGGKSTSFSMANHLYLYGCEEHPVTDEENKLLFSRFFASLKGEA